MYAKLKRPILNGLFFHKGEARSRDSGCDGKGRQNAVSPQRGSPSSLRSVPVLCPSLPRRQLRDPRLGRGPAAPRAGGAGEIPRQRHNGQRLEGEFTRSGPLWAPARPRSPLGRHPPSGTGEGAAGGGTGGPRWRWAGAGGGGIRSRRGPAAAQRLSRGLQDALPYFQRKVS